MTRDEYYDLRHRVRAAYRRYTFAESYATGPGRATYVSACWEEYRNLLCQLPTTDRGDHLDLIRGWARDRVYMWGLLHRRNSAIRNKADFPPGKQNMFDKLIIEPTQRKITAMLRTSP